MKRSVLIFFICITSFLQAQDLPEPMRPKRIVNDFTQLFSPQQQQALEQKLRNFNDTSSTQIAIVTVPTLQGYAPSDYAQRLAEKWGVGQRKRQRSLTSDQAQEQDRKRTSSHCRRIWIGRSHSGCHRFENHPERNYT